MLRISTCEVKKIIFIIMVSHAQLNLVYLRWIWFIPAWVTKGKFFGPWYFCYQSPQLFMERWQTFNPRRIKRWPPPPPPFMDITDNSSSTSCFYFEKLLDLNIRSNPLERNPWTPPQCFSSVVCMWQCFNITQFNFGSLTFFRVMTGWKCFYWDLYLWLLSALRSWASWSGYWLS